MDNFDNRVDIYIEKSADFAKPILKHLRVLIHQASPEIAETIKWGFPNFDYKGIVCSMASFKSHCAFNFWKSALLSDPQKILKKESAEAMGQLGKICSLNDLPADDVLIAYIREAVNLNKNGAKLPPRRTESSSKPIETPLYFQNILDNEPQAKVHFENFSNSHRKEYITWFEEAKTEATRNKRMAQALEWLIEGKGRNWKYETKK